MAGPTSPEVAGPTIEPPPLPFGWIAQWDASCQKYYFVQLTNGSSQWVVPTTPVATGETPSAIRDHPFDPPPELITHPDGSQTIRHGDGSMEPILPLESARALDRIAAEHGFSDSVRHLLAPDTSGQVPVQGAVAMLNPARKIVDGLSKLLLDHGHPSEPSQSHHSHQPTYPTYESGRLRGLATAEGMHSMGSKDLDLGTLLGQSIGNQQPGSQGTHIRQAPPYQSHYTQSAPTKSSGGVSYHQAPPSPCQLPAQLYPASSSQQA